MVSDRTRNLDHDIWAAKTATICCNVGRSYNLPPTDLGARGQGEAGWREGWKRPSFCQSIALGAPVTSRNWGPGSSSTQTASLTLGTASILITAAYLVESRWSWERDGDEGNRGLAAVLLRIVMASSKAEDLGTKGQGSDSILNRRSSPVRSGVEVEVEKGRMEARSSQKRKKKKKKEEKKRLLCVVVCC